MSNLVDLKELEELLKEENTPTRPARKQHQNRTVLKFIEESRVRPGEYRVPTFVIYYLFSTWVNRTKRKNVGKEAFFRTFKQHFEQVRYGKQRYYLVNDAWELTDELYEKAKTHKKRWQDIKKSER